MTVRIIPRLDIKGPNLVKGIHLEGLRVLGKPEQFARYYYEQGADELIYMDVVASLYERNSLLDIVERTSREIFIPLTVGGGIRSVDDIRVVLRAGADKVSLNTAVIQRPELIREAARTFGSSTIVVSIEAIRQPDGRYEAYTDCGRQRTGVDALTWARQATEFGAGELFVTSINNEGTGQGFDGALIRRIADVVSIPVIASGGAGNADHVHRVITDGHADAVSIASIVHYDYLAASMEDQHTAGDFAAEGNTEFLRRGHSFSKIQGASIPRLKHYLSTKGIACRH